jgi:adenylate cyclase class IV
MKNIEVEFRFEISDEEQAEEFLSRLVFVRRLQQKDVYFDTDTGDLFKRGIFIRTRNGKTLDFKFNLEDRENKHEDCDEHSFSLPLSESDWQELASVCKRLGLRIPQKPGLEAILEANGLKEFVVIDKVRKEFRDGEFTFCFDDIKGFGKFLEIEATAAKGTDLDELKRRMVERVRALNPKFLPTGYIELFVKKKDFNLYRQGRFILHEDKENG